MKNLLIILFVIVTQSAWAKFHPSHHSSSHSSHQSHSTSHHSYVKNKSGSYVHTYGNNHIILYYILRHNHKTGVTDTIKSTNQAELENMVNQETETTDGGKILLWTFLIIGGFILLIWLIEKIPSWLK